RALLPESGTDIKGRGRSEGDLRRGSGYADRPREFTELMKILDGEVRLITPTDPEGSIGEGPLPERNERYYQLTHDYLVPSVRDWLTSKQRETRRGRAMLLLEEHVSAWRRGRNPKHLPGCFDIIYILLFTDKKIQIDGRYDLIVNSIFY